MMKKLMGVAAAATLAMLSLTGCESMNSNQQRIGAAALGGAVGGGLGNSVGGGVGSAVGGGAGAAVGSKTQGGSNRNATYSGVGGAIGSAVGKSVFGGNAGAAIGGAIGGGAGAAIEQKIAKLKSKKSILEDAFFVAKKYSSRDQMPLFCKL